MDKRNIDYRIIVSLAIQLLWDNEIGKKKVLLPIIVSLGCKYIAQRMRALKKMPSDLYENFSVP